MTREPAWCPANLISTTISRQCVAASASSWAQCSCARVATRAQPIRTLLS